MKKKIILLSAKNSFLLGNEWKWTKQRDDGGDGSLETIPPMKSLAMAKEPAAGLSTSPKGLFCSAGPHRGRRLVGLILAVLAATLSPVGSRRDQPWSQCGDTGPSLFPPQQAGREARSTPATPRMEESSQEQNRGHGWSYGWESWIASGSHQGSGCSEQQRVTCDGAGHFALDKTRGFDNVITLYLWGTKGTKRQPKRSHFCQASFVAHWHPGWHCHPPLLTGPVQLQPWHAGTHRSSSLQAACSPSPLICLSASLLYRDEEKSCLLIQLALRVPFSTGLAW